MAGRYVEVRRVRSSLTAAFAKSNPPLIWRFDLERHRDFALALRQDAAGVWELTMDLPYSEPRVIASFAAREDAEDALDAIGDVLSRNIPGRIVGFFKWVGVAVVALIIVEMALPPLIRMFNPPTVASAGRNFVPPPVRSAPPAVENGEPVSPNEAPPAPQP